VKKDRWFRLKHDATGDVASVWGGGNIPIVAVAHAVVAECIAENQTLEMMLSVVMKGGLSLGAGAGGCCQLAHQGWTE
jgi:hypothetical protein